MPSEIISTVRLFPKPIETIPRDVFLSILDANVITFSPGAAVWMYDASKTDSLSPARLSESLQQTLNAYPQWAGQLKFVDYDPQVDEGHTGRFRRLKISYGYPNDPGVHFVVAHNDSTLASYIPNHAERPNEWDADHILSMGLLPTSPPLVLHNLADFAGLPSMIVQITTFACGSTVVSLKMAHPLADAQSLTTFVKDWAAIHTGEISSASPVFDPASIDGAAAGDIDSAEPDRELIRVSRSLPLNRFDIWSSSDGAAPFLEGATKVPDILANKSVERGTPLPWSELDLNVRVKYYLVRFTAEEIDRIWTVSKAEVSGEGISKFDALQAHVWSAIIRARRDDGLHGTFHLNVTLGVRDRIIPRLPSNFLGSPIFVTCVSAQADASSGELAASIRKTLRLFTPEKVGALLHSMAHETCLHRIWGAFWGKRHCIVTSWLRLGVYDVDFGAGKPRLMEGVMPSVDGCLQFMETGPAVDERWYSGGITVSLHLAEEVMARVVPNG